MTKTPGESQKEVSYALALADSSHKWYRDAAVRSRNLYRVSEMLLLTVSAAIPASAAIVPGNSTVPAILGSIVVILSGMRAVFHWQDNYPRFNGARQALEAERRLYFTSAEPYSDPGTRDQILAAMVSRIERDELDGWVKLAAERPRV